MCGGGAILAGEGVVELLQRYRTPPATRDVHCTNHPRQQTESTRGEAAGLAHGALLAQ